MMYSKMSKNCCKVYCTWCDVQVRQGGLGDLNIELWLTGRVLFLQQEIACDGDTCLIILGKLFLAKVIHPCV